MRQALTTPQLANEIGGNDYNFFETLGDAVLKVIFITKLHDEGAGTRDPGEITKIKQQLENDDSLRKIAQNEMNLEKFILKSEKQEIKGTKILADIFEAICGAIYLDSGHDIKLVEQKIINRFYTDFSSIIQNSRIFNKSDLIEYIQKIHRLTPSIECEYENYGTDNKPRWIARNPIIFPKELEIKLPQDLRSNEFSTKNEAEQNLFRNILLFLKKNS